MYTKTDGTCDCLWICELVVLSNRHVLYLLFHRFREILYVSRQEVQSGWEMASLPGTIWLGILCELHLLRGTIFHGCDFQVCSSTCRGVSVPRWPGSMGVKILKEDKKQITRKITHLLSIFLLSFGLAFHWSSEYLIWTYTYGLLAKWYRTWKKKKE